MFSHFFKQKFFAVILVAAVATAFSSILSFVNPFNNLHNLFSDFLYTENNPSKDIVIIAVDDKSTRPNPDGYGRFSQWNRDKFTNLLKILKAEKPKVITFDIIFHTYTTSVPKEKLVELEYQNKKQSNEDKVQNYEEFLKSFKTSLDDPIDEEFAQELNDFDNIIFAAAIDNGKLIGPLDKFKKNVELGMTNAHLDEKGTLRKVVPFFYLDSIAYDDMAVATVKKYLNKTEIHLPIDKNGEMFTNYFGDPFSYQMISFADVLRINFEPGFFKDKIVLIGLTTTKEVHDNFITPRSSNIPMPGVEIRANEIQTILEQKFLQNQSQVAQIFTIAGICLLLAIALNYFGVIVGTLLTLLSIGLYIAAAHFFFARGLILNMIYPFIAIILTYLASWVYKYFISDKAKREIKNAFSHYLSPDLIEEISKNPDQLKLGGETKTITVFFSDIKDSTTLSENTPIEQWVSQINEYFTAMERLIKNAKGTLDKYEGDAIMGFWNAPISQPDHAFRACVTALAMQKELKNLNEKWQKENRPTLEIRIGINCGSAIVGNFGSENRFDYTAMGDTVNTASRLESAANKTYGTNIIIAGLEHAQLTQEQKNQLILRELDMVFLPGKKEAVQIFEVVCLTKNLTPQIKEAVSIYAEALSAYRNSDYSKTIELLKQIPDDRPAQVLLKRTEILMRNEKIPEFEEKIYRITNK